MRHFAVFLNFVIQFFHSFIQISNIFCTVSKLLRDVVRTVPLKFIVDLVLQSCPEILCYCPYLYFYLGVDNGIREKHRYGHKHVIASIAALFWVFHIILELTCSMGLYLCRFLNSSFRMSIFVLMLFSAEV